MEAEGPSVTAFDRWLHKQLHEFYASVAREPLLDDLVALIDRSAGSPDRVGDEATEHTVG